MTYHEITNKQWKSACGWILIIIVLCIIGALIIFTKFDEAYKNHITTVETQFNKCIKLKTDVENSYIVLNKEAIGLKNTLASIKDKDQDGLMSRDIAQYIINRYTRVSKIVANAIAENVVLYSKQYNISPELIVGMIEIESRFNPMAVSSKDARGLMQVMPEWVPKLGLEKVRELHDIDVGIESGIKVFKIHLEEANGNVAKGLYYYVGKSKEYSNLVFSAMGKFVTYRSTIDDSEKSSEEVNGGNDEPADEDSEGTETTDNS